MLPTHALLLSLLLTPSLQDKEASRKARTAEQIVKEWKYRGDLQGKAGRSSGFSAAPPGVDNLYAMVGETTYGSYADAWNFYAAKCGTDMKYKPKNIYVGGKKVKDGEYIIIDQSLDSALFVFRTKEYVVSATIREGKENAVLVTVTVNLP